MTSPSASGTRFHLGPPALAWVLMAAVAACSPGSETPADETEAPNSATFDLSRASQVFDAGGTSLGTVAFDTSCQAADDVRLGLALLHHMTYAEAARTFQRVGTEDPSCVMAPWGVAMSYLHPLWPDVPTPEQLDRGWELLQDARALGTASPREAALVEALEAYYRDGNERTERQRLTTYAEAWERVAATYPQDAEVALFEALSMIAVTLGVPERVDERVGAGLVAEQVLEAIPDHPGAHHYVIHAYDIPAAAEQALPAARRYGAVAPANSHALHMTSHIFTRRGIWRESIDYNRRAADAAWEEPIAGQVSHHYLHAVDYLIYAHLQRGADDDARAVLSEVGSVEGPVVNHAASAYTFAAAAARYALERHAWDEAADIRAREPAAIPWDAYPYLEAIPVFAKALGSALIGDLAAAREATSKLADLAAASEATSVAYDWATQVRIQELAARAWTAYAQNSRDEAISLMTEAAELEASTEKNPVTPGEVLPAGELLGDMLLAAGRPAEALQAYVAAMERTPNRFNSLYGAARAAEAAGMNETAADYYGRLVAVAGDSTTRRRELERARSFVSEG